MRKRVLPNSLTLSELQLLVTRARSLSRILYRMMSALEEDAKIPAMCGQHKLEVKSEIKNMNALLDQSSTTLTTTKMKCKYFIIFQFFLNFFTISPI